MIELGKIQELEVIEFTKNGAYLGLKDDPSNERVLLPKKEVASEIERGDKVKVFVYKDSKDRIIATTKRPKLSMGELTELRVVDTTDIGAFLDWGLEKDLFLPFKEQRGRVKKGGTYFVGLYIDKSERLCASMNISKLLRTDSPYKPNDRTRGTIYSINEEIGAFVAVDNKYHGLIPKKELHENYLFGDQVEVRVKSVRKDGKLELSLRKQAYKQIDDDAEKILDKLKSKGGTLGLNDNSSPIKIKAELSMSKSAFKRAVGRLLKNRKIKITEKGIELIKKA